MTKTSDPSLDDTAKFHIAGLSVSEDDSSLDAAGMSDVGGRESNEDQFVVATIGTSATIEQSGLSSDFQVEPGHPIHLLLVADGLGGQASGEIASAMASECVLGAIVHEAPGAPWESVVAAAIGRADREVLSRAATDGKLKGMATTMTVAIISRARMVVGHAGDSRCYLLRDGQLERLTRDHTAAQRIIDASGETGPEADVDHLRHVLVNVVGGEHGGVSVDLLNHSLRGGDRFLLCSDGLTGVVSDERLAEILGSAATASAACRALINEANEAGTQDNVTVAVGFWIARTERDDAEDDTAKMFEVEA